MFSDGNQPVLSGKILAFRSPNNRICHFHHNFLRPLTVPRSRPTTRSFRPFVSRKNGSVGAPNNQGTGRVRGRGKLRLINFTLAIKDFSSCEWATAIITIALINVIPAHSDHPVMLITPKHILNAINYNFISQQPYLSMIRN